MYCYYTFLYARIKTISCIAIIHSYMRELRLYRVLLLYIRICENKTVSCIAIIHSSYARIRLYHVLLLYIRHMRE